VQGAQLLNDEEQEDDHWPSRVQEVLQALPQAPGAQGNEVETTVVSEQCAVNSEKAGQAVTSVHRPLNTVHCIQGRKLNG